MRPPSPVTCSWYLKARSMRLWLTTTEGCSATGCLLDDEERFEDVMERCGELQEKAQ